MATHREQLVAMLEDARIDFAYTGGDSVIVEGATRFEFFIDGRLRDVHHEGADGYDDEV